ncbi:MAG: Hsp20 family protein [Rubrivivax sp.]|nr:MAG: Hsp20 family protein [Rubrivivax sp.]
MTINLEKSIDIQAPVEDVFNVWTQFSKFPDFMKGSAENAEITDEVPNESISWQTVKGVRSNATVKFASEGDTTTVTVSVHYPNGVGNDTTAQDVAQDIENDLQRFAKLILGQPPAGLQDSGGRPADAAANEDVDADVLGPAYSLSSPEAEQNINHALEIVRSFEQTMDSAASAWLQSVVRAFEAPFNEMRRLTEQFDRGFGSFMWGGLERRRVLVDASNGWVPQIDVAREDNTLKVSVTLPGASKDDVKVEIRDGKLLISAEYNISADGGSSSHFEESIDLLNAVDSTKVDARMDEQGRLEVTLPLHEAREPQETHEEEHAA